jgi:plasmid maintenance system antidote protein VapI
MKVRKKLLLQMLDENSMTVEGLARNMGVGVGEIKKLLDGQAVDEPTARKFISYFGADDAQRLIDWEALGKINPLACEADKERDDSERGGG